MSDNKETFQESILIKRAKRRLLGATTILLILLGLSYVFIEDRTGKYKKGNVKVSFLEMSDYALSEKATDAYNEDILSVLSLSDYPEQTHSQGSNF